MKTTTKIIAIVLSVALCLSLCACGNKNQQTNDYSVGLLETGYYVNWDKNNCQAIDFTKAAVTVDEVLEWCVDNAEEDSITTIDEYVYQYTNQFLIALGLGIKDTVADGDMVEINMSFSIDGQPLEDYQSTNAVHTASSTGDVIVQSFIGHKADDKYQVQYTFPAEDTYYPNQVADVDIEILAIAYADPLKEEGIVENNLDKICEYVEGTTDKESLLVKIRPLIAEAMLPQYVQEVVQQYSDYDVPQEYVEYELSRFKTRLDRLGYTYEHYLAEAKVSDTEIRIYCESIAQENCIYLRHYDSMDYEITDEMLVSAYGENYDYIKEVQGIGYMRLDIIREIALEDICSQVNLIGRVENSDEDKETIDEVIDDNTSTETDATEPTTESTENS